MSPNEQPTTEGSPDQLTASDDLARYQIGEVAERTGVTQRTLRFYEEKGLLTPADRMEGGFRLYSESDVGRIKLIKQLQQLLGFSLAEIKEMVEAEEIRATLRAQRAGENPPRNDPSRAQQALRALKRQLAVVEPKLQQLTELRADLLERIERTEHRLQEMAMEAPAR
jgi:DNA-binding transcriptional MerR regulator